MKRNLLVTTFAILLIAMSGISCSNTGSSDFDRQVDHALDFSVRQLKATVAAITDSTQLPVSTLPDGTWKTGTIYDWRSGHYPGCLWLAYEYSGDEVLKAAAEKWTGALEPIKDYTGNHDVGFMIYCSYGQGYRLTGNKAYEPVMVKAAESLSTRYKPTTGVIQSWKAGEKWKFPVIIDNMMNLELLFWAHKNGGNTNLYAISVEHADITVKNHIRENGSTFHVVDYDPETGEARARNTAQGYADDSTWSRGQAWGVYGYTMTYRETGNTLYLDTACRLADFFIDNLPEDNVPYWDFNAPNIPNEPRDTAAAAVAASGLLELSTHVKDKQQGERYYGAALDILGSLCSPEYLTEGTNSPGLLQHATSSVPHDSEIDVSLIYGDYYFLEALLRYKRGIEQ